MGSRRAAAAESSASTAARRAPRGGTRWRFRLSSPSTAGRTASGRYVTWAPAPCRLRVVDADGAVTPIPVRVRSRPGAGGKLVFRLQPAGAPSDELNLSLAANGTPTAFFVRAGSDRRARADRDAVFQVRPATGTQVIASVPMMVRIRKDAETLSIAERGRFLERSARLEQPGRGPFRDFRVDAHRRHHRRGARSRRIHALAPRVPARSGTGAPEARPFRDAPLLALRPASAEAVLRDVSGRARPSGRPSFSPSNPLQSVGHRRPDRHRPHCRASTRGPGPPTPTGAVAAELVIVGSAVGYGALRPLSRAIPMGGRIPASGLLSQIGSAARDPLFFLLHCNVDRLWAKWQWFQRRFDVTQATTFAFRGSRDEPGARRASGTTHSTRCGRGTT